MSWHALYHHATLAILIQAWDINAFPRGRQELDGLIRGQGIPIRRHQFRSKWVNIWRIHLILLKPYLQLCFTRTPLLCGTQQRHSAASITAASTSLVAISSATNCDLVNVIIINTTTGLISGIRETHLKRREFIKLAAQTRYLIVLSKTCENSECEWTYYEGFFLVLHLTQTF